jgi:hypothetical protein
MIKKGNNGDVVMLMSGDWSTAFRKLSIHPESKMKRLRKRFVWLNLFFPKSWIRNYLLK